MDIIQVLIAYKLQITNSCQHYKGCQQFIQTNRCYVLNIKELDKCRGQAYDGAANMSGKHRGIAALIKQEENAAVHVHCLAHSLNLSLQDTV